MKHIHTFENFLNEGNVSMYNSTVQDALKLLGYKLKQSEFKVGVKKEKLYDLITLNGELLCSSSDYAQMLSWMQNAIKEDPEKYGLDPKVLESTNEANNLDYWTQYSGNTKNTVGQPAPAWMSEPCKTMSEVIKCVDSAIKDWNGTSEDGPISKSAEQHIGDLAIRYWKQFKTINGNIITAMIMQES